MTSTAAFWDRIAPGYAKRPISNMDAYTHTLDRVRAYLSPTDTALEVGCGTGSTALALAPHLARITGTDVSPEMIRIAAAKVHAAETHNAAFVVADVQGSPDVAPGPFDVVMAFNLLHLLEDTDKGLATLADLIPQGGLLITKTPCLKGMALLFGPLIWVLQRFGKAPFVRYLSPAGLDGLIRDAGFDIIETGNFPARRPPSHFVVARKR